MSQSLKWLAIAYFLVYNFVASWYPLARHVKGGGRSQKKLFIVQTNHHGFSGMRAPPGPTKSRPCLAPQKLAKPLEQSGAKLISIHGNYKKRYNFFSINVCLIGCVCLSFQRPPVLCLYLLSIPTSHFRKHFTFFCPAPRIFTLAPRVEYSALCIPDIFH